MTTTFRLDAITLNTTEGEVTYRFPSDLTVLAGPTGVGKTTLLELVKFGFGGDADIAEVARDYVIEVRLDATLGASRYSLARTVDPTKRKIVRVTDLITRERIADHHVTTAEPSLSGLLMTALGFPADMRAPSRTATSTNPGARISFMDIFSFLYVPQQDINREIAHSSDSYREPKRKAVFEILFGITDAEALGQLSLVNELTGKIERAEQEVTDVAAFLKSTNTTTREQALSVVEQAMVDERDASAALAAMRDSLDPVSDRETQVLRDLLTDAERSAAESRSLMLTLTKRRDEYELERRRISGDLDRLSRIVDAGHRLAKIEFEVCPRCVQSLAGREVPTGACRVCLQPDPTPGGMTEFDQYEAKQLRDQLEEIERQFGVLSQQMEQTSVVERDRRRRAAELTALIEHRTHERITPRLQAFADSSQKLAEARALQLQMEGTLRQWDRLQDIDLVASELRSEREEAKAALRRLQDRLAERRGLILADLSEEFERTVSLLGIPSVTSAAISPTNYLPIINGESWDRFGPRGGGRTTAVQVAYWATLLAVAQKHSWTSYPAFLLIDSPRLAVNNSEELSAALYRRLVALAAMNIEYAKAGVRRAKMQLIIADNNLPPEYRASYTQVDFTIANPTVSTIRHPGPSMVKTLVVVEDDIAD
ncbi:AAA family ATPase [Hamadaea sp. NPDC050747]|uniref:AAA family ATPase n=1 Tax=Hamadaea sp. NPDC050747 TaxID=3155789 RepID=UPI003407F21A